jgi:fatty-acyl-CoA synthase
MKSPLTPLDFLTRAAHVYPEVTAWVEGERRIPYREMNERVHRFASALAQNGIEPGDRVAVLAHNGSLALEAHFAVPMAGAVLVALNTRNGAQELAWILEHCGAKALLGDPELLRVLEPVRAGLHQLLLVSDDYEAFMARGSFPFAPQNAIDEDQMISINYTSGTTGVPKGVMYTHRSTALNAMGEIIEHGLSNRSVYLWTVPMFHCNGWSFPWAITAVGARHILIRQPDPRQMTELILAEGVTHLCGAPVVVNNLCQYCVANGIRFERGLYMVTGGAPPAPATLRQAEEIGVTVAHVYGLTESYGPHSLCVWHAEWDALPIADRARLKARQGVTYTMAGNGMRVVDQDMNDVPADGETMGEVVMSGNNVMLGYYRSPEATAEAFRGGWFHSGDLGVMHPDGYLELRDRSKDIVISGGENISSIEVEKTVADHPAVLEVAVVAFPDEKWGEVPKAHVTLKEGFEVTEREIIEFCRARLSHFKCPKMVEFGVLPRTATGKIRKNELRDRAWAGREKRVN